MNLPRFWPISADIRPTGGVSARSVGAPPFAFVLSWPVLSYVAAAFIFLILRGAWSRLAGLGELMGDTDDAMRWVELQDWLTGQGWFDLTQYRVSPPDFLPMHWSRLIDAGLAVLNLPLQLVLSADHAALLTRFLWPCLVLLPLLFVIARVSQRLGGKGAALAALLLVVTSGVATGQFQPGRIDHHNVQILCAVTAFLVLALRPHSPGRALAAGAVGGLGLMIGLEAIALHLAFGAAYVVLVVVRPRCLPALAGYVAGLAGMSLAIFLITVPPARYGSAVCDAMAINAIGALCLLAAGLALSKARLAALPNGWRIAGLCALGLVAAAAYLAPNPACAGGPFAQMDPAIRPIWLDHVQEGHSLAWLFAERPAEAFAQAAFILAGAAAAGWLAHKRRDVGAMMQFVLILVGFAMSCWQLKLAPYATWLAIPALATWLATLPGTAKVSPFIMRAGALFLVAQQSLFVLASGVALAFAPHASTSEQVAGDTCFTRSALLPLGRLPAGLIAAPIDMGPHLLAHTHHLVVAAPYHRLSRAIIDNAAMAEAKPEEALALLRQWNVDYLVLCPGSQGGPSVGASVGVGAPATMAQALQQANGMPPLEAVIAEGPVRVWRVPR